MTHLTTPLKPRFKQAPAHQPRLADDIYEQILSAILQGDVVPGERIVQESVAREINVSRTPVREALLRLEHEGIIEGSNRRGFSIRRFTEAEVRELYMAREAVEGYCARRVAALNQADQLTAIEVAISRESTVDPSDLRAYFDVNRMIHRTIVEQAGNLTLLGMFDSIWNRGISLPMFALTLSDQDNGHAPLQHGKLLEALRSTDPDLAYTVMTDHIQEGLDSQLSHL